MPIIPDQHSPPRLRDCSPAVILIALVLLALLAAAEVAWCSERGTDTDGDTDTDTDTSLLPEDIGDPDDDGSALTVYEIEAGIIYLAQFRWGKHQRRYYRIAEELAADIRAAAIANDVPAELILATAERETKLRHDGPRGKLGERGIVQVHPNTGRRFRCNLKTQRGQLDCGAAILAHGYRRCGTWRGAVTYYAGSKGACRAKPGTRLERVARDRTKLAAVIRAKAKGIGE